MMFSTSVQHTDCSMLLLPLLMKSIFLPISMFKSFQSVKKQIKLKTASHFLKVLSLLSAIIKRSCF